jgi:D-serine deaminase-like pyridoxal phosphate-dependent protein
VRPHAKTHKCLEIAARQIAAGAVGLTVAKVDEALVFIEQGIRSITVAYPIVVDSKLARLFEAARSEQVYLRMIVDSPIGVEALANEAARQDVRLGVYIKIDVGLHRCGLSPEDPRLVPLAQSIDKNDHLRLVGLLSHAGHSYAACDADEARQIATQEQQSMRAAQEHLARAGYPVTEISVGATPTVLASDNFEGITEIRPGNYVFVDQTARRIGLVDIDAIALTVLATVISCNDAYVIVDAGSKVLSSDSGAHGSGSAGFGVAYPAERFGEPAAELMVQKLSEEHGWLKRMGDSLDVGSLVRIIPNHSCAVVGLADTLTVIRDGKPIDEWRVAARGCVR